MSEFGGLWKQQQTQHALKVSESSYCWTLHESFEQRRRGVSRFVISSEGTTGFNGA